jgi:orotidine-5'-phosphate decarboxylase
MIAQILHKQSALCIGLDPELFKLPAHLLSRKNPTLDFCKEIIDSTHDLCVAYKPNLAFFEAQGTRGWDTLVEIVEYIPDQIFKIADAKRGDIGNTSKKYADVFFKQMNFDAVTVAPYMGIDSVTPFLEYDDKWVIVLGLTSNAGSSDFQRLKLEKGGSLYEEVLRKSSEWGSIDNMMYVVGATHAEDFVKVRDILPDHFLLVPGVGAQGGDMDAVFSNGMSKDVGLLINASRSILYASSDENYAELARVEAQKMNEQMVRYIN